MCVNFEYIICKKSVWKNKKCVKNVSVKWTVFLWYYWSLLVLFSNNSWNRCSVFASNCFPFLHRNIGLKMKPVTMWNHKVSYIPLFRGINFFIEELGLTWIQNNSKPWIYETMISHRGLKMHFWFHILLGFLKSPDSSDLWHRCRGTGALAY